MNEKKTMPEHEQRCRELAELRCERGPDPRFAALRGKENVLGLDDTYPDGTPRWWLRTDGDALDEAIADYGLHLDNLGRTPDREWHCWVATNGDQDSWWGYGATSRAARSMALWQAVFG